MTAILSSPWASALGVALLHLLWQGALIALLVALLQPWLRRASAAARYGVALGGLVLIPVAFVVTLLVSRQSAALAWLPHLTAKLPQVLPWLVAIWLLGVALMALRAIGGWCLLQHLRRRVRPPAAWLAAQFELLRRRAGLGSHPRLGLSAEIDAPCALGFWRPLVLLPVCALTALTPDQLQAILAHELAHIRRYDYLVNLLQRAVEVVFFYHPAVWWLSHQVALEREHCCDDAAIALCGDRAVYAHALLALAGTRAPSFSMAATGAATGSGLPHRLRRILGQTTSLRPWRMAAGMLLLAAFSVALLAPGTATAVAAPVINPPAPTIVAVRPPPSHVSVAPALVPHPAKTAARVPAPRLAPEPLKISVTLAAFQTCAPQFVWIRQSDDFGRSWLTLFPVLHCQQVLAPVLHLTT